jgi:hypothetical protein
MIGATLEDKSFLSSYWRCCRGAQLFCNMSARASAASWRLWCAQVSQKARAVNDPTADTEIHGFLRLCTFLSNEKPRSMIYVARCRKDRSDL